MVTGTGDLAGSTGSYTLIINNVAVVVDTNDQISEAISVNINSTVSGSILNTTDVNVYKYVVVAGQHLSFNINITAGSTFDSYIRIFNSSGTLLISNDNGAASGETLAYSSYVEYTFVTGGTYYIGVSGAPNIAYNVLTGTGDVPGSTGAYTLVINNVTSSTDTNDQISEATLINIGSIVSDVISVGTDVNLYAFTVTAGDKIGFDIDLPAGSLLDSYLRIFNGSGTQLTFNNDGAAPGESLGKASYVEYTFTTGGTYYIGVSGYGNTGYNAITGTGDISGSTGGYTLNPVLLNPQTDNDPDDQLTEAHAMTLGTTVSDSISTATDVDMYKFTAVAGHRIGFNINGSGDTYLRVFDGNGSNLVSNDDGAAPGETLGKAAYVEYTFVATGTYYVAVSGGKNYSYNAITGLGDTPSTTGAYTLTTTYIGEADPDDQISEARSIVIGGATISDSINVNVDVDMYAFTVAAGQRVGFDVRLGAGSSLSSYIRLFNSSARNWPMQAMELHRASLRPEVPHILNMRSPAAELTT